MKRFLVKSAKSAIPLGVYSLYHRIRHGGKYPQPYDLYGAPPVIPVADVGRLFGLSTECDVRVPMAPGTNDDMTLPFNESAALAYLCRSLEPQRVLEIGTYVGGSTRIIAENTPDECRIITIDVKPVDFYLEELKSRTSALPLSYLNAPVRSKITQIVGDSTTYDFSEHAGSMDLVFVDGNHSYPCVSRDSQNALMMVRPGGAVIWDDYLWPLKYPECAGVTKAVNEVNADRECFLIAGTRMAVHCSKS